MRKRIVRALCALGAVAGLGLWFAGPAGATTYKVVYTATWSGINDVGSGTTSTAFKLVSTEFTVPTWTCAPDGHATTQGIKYIGASLVWSGTTVGAADYAPCKPSGGYAADSVHFAATGTYTIGHNVSLGGIHAGDQILVEVHYQLSNNVMYFYARDLTTNQLGIFNVNMEKVEEPDVLPTSADIGVTMDNADITPPSSSVALASFTNCLVDSNTHVGIGATSTHWHTQEVFDSLDATSNPLTLAASLGSTGLVNNGQNFTVYLRPTA
jgi:hypothetical protein